MSDLFADKYRIETTRLGSWDYSRSGYYFITICARDRVCWFGGIINGMMQLSRVGEIICDYWFQIPTHFNDVMLDEFVVMPNHVHGIIIIKQTNRKPNRRDGACPVSTNLGNIVGSFKSAASKRIREIGHKNFAWQSRFYDHVIRDEKSLDRIRKYIANNPNNWTMDRNNPQK